MFQHDSKSVLQISLENFHVSHHSTMNHMHDSGSGVVLEDGSIVIAGSWNKRASTTGGEIQPPNPRVCSGKDLHRESPVLIGIGRGLKVETGDPSGALSARVMDTSLGNVHQETSTKLGLLVKHAKSPQMGPDVRTRRKTTQMAREVRTGHPSPP